MTGPEPGSAGSPQPAPQEGDIVPADPEAASFVAGLVERGEAARPGPDGSLPAQATHEIVGETAAGLPILRRRRFRSS